MDQFRGLPVIHVKDANTSGETPGDLVFQARLEKAHELGHSMIQDKQIPTIFYCERCGEVLVKHRYDANHADRSDCLYPSSGGY